MIRAAAKNHEHVHVVVDLADYSQLLEALSGRQSAEQVVHCGSCLQHNIKHCATCRFPLCCALIF